MKEDAKFSSLKAAYKNRPGTAYASSAAVKYSEKVATNNLKAVVKDLRVHFKSKDMPKA